MIQRRQTLYLLLAAILLIAAALLPLGCCTIGCRMTVSALYPYPQAPFGYGAMLVLSAIIALYAIFLYHNRRWQMRIATVDILLIILSYGVFFIYHSVAPEQLPAVLGITHFLPLVAIFFVALAIQGIRKDEKLIRSLDRLR